MVFDTVSYAERFIDAFASVYLLAIFLYILTSWIRLPYSLNPVQRFLDDICGPYLRLWRRILPLSAGPIDFSPMVAIIGLIAAWRIIIWLLDRLH